ncbi:MAG: ChaN family lipoprotein [Phycisphaerae bacterium]|nr:ChaN family lipoprotein [Phycisphaerae bacterium]
MKRNCTGRVIGGIAFLVLLAGGAFQVGCASPNRGGGGGAAALAPSRAAPLADGSTGEPIAWEALVARAAEADAVLIGELHGQPVGQAFLAAFMDDVLARAPGAAVALEFFERDQQVALDDYLAGITAETAFREAAGRKSESSYPFGHRAMVEASKRAGRPVIAANAPRRYVRLARTQGYERLKSLPPEVSRLFRIPEAEPTGRYFDDFAGIMARGGRDEEPAKPGAEGAEGAEGAGGGGWGGGGGGLTDAQREAARATFRSQSLWDWTMGESVARAIGPADAERGRPVVLVVGAFHVSHDGGLVQALRHMNPSARVLRVIMVDQVEPKPLPERLKGVGDVIVWVGEQKSGGK